MPRVKGGVTSRKRHNKALKAARGYWGNRSKSYKMATEAAMHAGQYAYAHRRTRKRDFRRLWIARINAACRLNGITYSRFINGLSLAGVGLDRKALADLAVQDAAAFATLVQHAAQALSPPAA